MLLLNIIKKDLITKKNVDPPWQNFFQLEIHPTYKNHPKVQNNKKKVKITIFTATYCSTLAMAKVHKDVKDYVQNFGTNNRFTD